MHFHVGPLPENTPRALKEWIARHFRMIGINLQTPHPIMLTLDKLYAEPDRPEDGMTVYADGSTWNPGSGEGIYTYYGSAWNKLG